MAIGKRYSIAIFLSSIIHLYYYIKNRDHDGIIRCMNEINRYIGRDVTLPVETLLDFTKSHIMSLPADFIEENPYLISKCVGAALNDGDGEGFTRYADMLYRKFPAILSDYPDHIETACLAIGTDFRVPVKECIRRIIEFAPLMKRTEAPGVDMRITSFTLNFPYYHRSMRDFSEYHDLRPDDFANIRLAFESILDKDYDAQERSLKAGLLYERGELMEALREAFNAYAACGKALSPESVFSAHSILSWILYAMGAQKDADKILTRMEVYLKENAPCLLPNLRAMQANRAIRAGNTDAAEEWLRMHAPHKPPLTFYQICQHFTTLRAYIALGRYGEAAQFGSRLYALATEYARPMDRIESALLIAIACNKAGNAKSALEHMKNAMLIAIAYGFTQLFYNEAKEIMPLILALRDKKSETAALRNFAETLAANVLDHAPESKGNATVIKLSPMRRKALELLDRGLSYSEIAKEMGLKHNTVKRHISLAYEQLGVHDSLEAIAKAKTLRLFE